MHEPDNVISAVRLKTVYWKLIFNKFKILLFLAAVLVRNGPKRNLHSDVTVNYHKVAWQRMSLCLMFHFDYYLNLTIN